MVGGIKGLSKNKITCCIQMYKNIILIKTIKVTAILENDGNFSKFTIFSKPIKKFGRFPIKVLEIRFDLIILYTGNVITYLFGKTKTSFFATKDLKLFEDSKATAVRNLNSSANQFQVNKPSPSSFYLTQLRNPAPEIVTMYVPLF